MAILTIDTSDKRDVKALELAARAEEWHRLTGGAFGVLSSDGYERYRVTAETCSCEDSRRGQVCKHRRAVRIHAALTNATAPTDTGSCGCQGRRHTCERWRGLPVTVREGGEPCYCQCSASGSQGSCGFVSDEASELQDHYRDVHGWELDRAVVESMRGRKPLTPEAEAALFRRLEGD